MNKKTGINDEQELLKKMMQDKGFAYKHIKSQHIEDFSYHFNHYNLKRYGRDETETFHDFITFILDNNSNGVCRLASYDQERGAFRTWISAAMSNYCKDIFDEAIKRINELLSFPDEKEVIGSSYAEEDDYQCDDRTEILRSTIGCVKNDMYRAILDDLLVRRLTYDETKEKYGDKVSNFSLYKKRAIAEYVEVLLKARIISLCDRNDILSPRRKSRSMDEPMFAEFITTGFSLVVNRHPEGDTDWLVQKLHDLLWTE